MLIPQDHRRGIVLPQPRVILGELPLTRTTLLHEAKNKNVDGHQGTAIMMYFFRTWQGVLEYIQWARKVYAAAAEK